MTHGILALRQRLRGDANSIILGGETGAPRLEHTMGKRAGSPKAKAREVTGRRERRLGDEFFARTVRTRHTSRPWSCFI